MSAAEIMGQPRRAGLARVYPLCSGPTERVSGKTRDRWWREKVPRKGRNFMGELEKVMGVLGKSYGHSWVELWDRLEWVQRWGRERFLE